MHDDDIRTDDDRSEHYHREVYDAWEEDLGPAAEMHRPGLDLGLLVARLGTLLLVPHGVHKATDMSTFVREVGDNVLGAQAPEFFAWMIMLGQVGLPVLIALGLFTRPAAFLVAGSLSTIWLLEIYLSLDYQPLTPEGGLTGEAVLLLVALSLALVFTGAGRWSLDAMRTGGRP